MIFYPAEQLREEFKVTASFYQIEVSNKIYQCRNHALITRKRTNSKRPDAVMIMANPGSCSPKKIDCKPTIIQKHPANAPYVDVNIDPTQYQLMRLMKLMEWNMVSIINLSDLCSGDMVNFSQKLKEVEGNGYFEHSIFSEIRAQELKKALVDSNTKIILAWGKHPSIRKLACKAINRLKDYHIVGLASLKGEYGYRHPNPMLKEKCIEWLEDMHKQLTQNTTIDIRCGESIEKKKEERCDEK